MLSAYDLSWAAQGSLSIGILSGDYTSATV